MKTSVLIIAHNEEQYIEQCIESVLGQTQKADEIIVLVHNSTDATLKKVRAYSVTAIPYDGPAGIVSARIEGLSHVSGDIILCMDGDSYASPNWIEVMTETLSRNENILAGSWIKFKGTFVGEILNMMNKYLCISRKHPAQWIWGPNIVFWGRDKETVKIFLQKSSDLSAKLNLSRNPEDYWLALMMSNRGRLEVTNKTWVAQHSKNDSSAGAAKRGVEDVENMNKIRAYFEQDRNEL